MLWNSLEALCYGFYNEHPQLLFSEEIRKNTVNVQIFQTLYAIPFACKFCFCVIIPQILGEKADIVDLIQSYLGLHCFCICHFIRQEYNFRTFTVSGFLSGAMIRHTHTVLPIFAVCLNKPWFLETFHVNHEISLLPLFTRSSFYFKNTQQPLYNMVCYNTVLDITRFKDGSQTCIDYIEKWP